MTQMMKYEGMEGTQKNRVLVAVRFRPLSDKERGRGDHEVWECSGNAVGILEDVGMKVKFIYDHVFEPRTDNRMVYKTVASPIVQSALDGINGTVFAYGVTSSGKTHTMMGTDDAPGIVPHAIAEVFRCIARTPNKEFLLRLSMMEIYNEVLNDLLDPARTNLRLREDQRKAGNTIYVEGIREETLVSAEHALQIIAAGNEQRKTSATAFNEGSSRSHTIIRITIEASDRADALTDPNVRLGRTISYLNLIDLAGSESAKAEVNKSQRMEGSFINKSLLTLGTVIHKLSEGKAAHIPFRDSKLTRLLQGSLTGSGARIAVICTITPASTQAEETHNTLKFASRAKRIEVSVARNEIMDQSSLIARYQQEIQLLKGQLDMVMRERGGLPMHDPLHPEVRTLRERLEEERQALLARERDKLALQQRIARLTQCILHGAAAATQMERRLRAPPSEQAAAAATAQASSLSLGLGAEASAGSRGTAPPPLADVATTVAGVRGAGALFPGSELERASTARGVSETVEVEADLLRRQVHVLATELAERDRMLQTIHSMRGYGSGGAASSSTRGGGGGDGDEDDVAMQVMLADRDFMQTQLQAADEHSGKLALALERMRRKLAAATGVDPESIDYGLDASPEEEEGDLAELAEAARPLRHGYDHVLAEKVLKMEEKVLLVLQAIRAKEEQLSNQRHVLETLTGLEDQVQVRLRELEGENGSLRQELERLDAQNNNLQGYNLDYMSNEDLGELIGSLTQAVERVRITVQLRRLASKKGGGGGGVQALNLSLDGSTTSGGMTREAMRLALEELQSNGHSRRTTAMSDGSDFSPL